MKKLLAFMGNILYIGTIICDVIEILVVPVLFSVIGILNQYPWQYYAVSIGGFFAIAIIIQSACHLILKRFEKKYESTLVKLFRKTQAQNKENHLDP